MPGLARDARFGNNRQRVANRTVLEAMIEARIGEHPRATVTAWLEGADIPTGVVNDIPALAAHAQLAARGRWATVATPGGEIPALLPPHNIAGTAPRMAPVPALGEHGTEIIRALGRAPRRGKRTSRSSRPRRPS